MPTVNETTPLPADSMEVPEIPTPSVKVPVVRKRNPSDLMKPSARHERAKHAANVRHERNASIKSVAESKNPEAFDWENSPFSDCEQFLSHLRNEIERGAGIVQRRYGQLAAQGVTCVVCGAPIQPGRWALQKSRRDHRTGLLVPSYYCTQQCVARENLRTQGIANVPR